MLRILIVDDERIVLNGIRIMIEEELEFPFSVDIVTASNVPQAIELLDSFEPDLILTDIRMPVMDGFTLIQKVREKMLPADIVILTSHADFEYAQQAIRFKVMDFILKPIDQQVLKQMIERVYRQKSERKQLRVNSAVMEIRNMMLYDLSVQELIVAPELIDQLFPYTYFTVVVFTVPRVEEMYPQRLREILSRRCGCCYCFVLAERRQLIAICNHEQFRIRLSDLKQELDKTVQPERIGLGISISANSYKVLHTLYVNAVQRVFYSKTFGDESLLSEIALFTYQDCIQIFIENDESVVKGLLEEYLIKIMAVFDSVGSLDAIYLSFIQNIRLYLENSGVQIQEEWGKTNHQLGNHWELIAEIMQQLKVVKRMLQKADSNDELSRKLLDYIRIHYQEDISLEDLAKYVGFHPNYICSVFKKNIGLSYLACLHRERLAVAKKLLQETDYTTERIAGEVGYNSATQFARVFRKYEGMSPSGFRNTLKNR